ncbi:phosphotransferase family protein [Streptomyces sp. NBC_00987]|uniref:phosphotransferase family protein n=1 Tax=Streptomyces sp. NBC_00987 TaxID=2903703 RepID=UPI003868D868|nr:aminoglycoside phosphotransferase family protein [Streptomyces sp. NBC_00987]
MSHTAPAETAARDAARQLGLSTRSLASLHDHATTVFLLPEEDLVLRVAPKSRNAGMSRAVTLARWLTEQDLPVPEAADVPQPVLTPSHTVTFWTYYPQQSKMQAPGAKHLGSLLRRLHSLPAPPLGLPAWQPLTSLHEVLSNSTALGSDQAEWLLWRRQELLAQYDQLEFPLGQGMLHGDAYPGNCLWDERSSKVRLTDWDEASIGPREVDLANTYQGVRFGRSQSELRAFRDSYGYDITKWSGLPVLKQIRELHTLGSYVRRADRNDLQALQELEFRITTLRQGDTRTLWSAN